MILYQIKSKFINFVYIEKNNKVKNETKPISIFSYTINGFSISR